MSEKSTTKKRGFDGDMVVEGADRGQKEIKKPREELTDVNRCKQELARLTRL